MSDSMIFGSPWHAPDTERRRYESTAPALVLLGGGGRSTDACSSEYEKRVIDAGFELDHHSIQLKEIASVRAAREGRRNRAVFRAATELVRCGIDPVVLTHAAMQGGLARSEVETTVQKAVSNFSSLYGPTVLDFVEDWLLEWRGRFARRFHPLLDEFAQHAVSQNTRRPFVIQAEVGSRFVVDQSTISRWVRTMNDRGALRVIERGMGRRGRRPNYYELLRPAAESENPSDPAAHSADSI